MRADSRSRTLQRAIIALALSSLAVCAAQGSTSWQRAHAMSGGEDPSAMVGDAAGGLYVVGSGASAAGAFLARLDQDGQVRWQKVLRASTAPVVLMAVALMPDGGCVISGNAHFAGFTYRAGWLARFDADGIMLWERDVRWNSGTVTLDSVAVLPIGDVLTIAKLDSRLSRSHVVLRYAPDGSHLASVGILDGETPEDLVLTADGGFACVGFYPMPAASGLGDQCWIAKFDSSAVLEWAWEHGDSRDERLHAVMERPGGGYLAVGRTQLVADGQDVPWVVEVHPTGEIGDEWVLDGPPAAFTDMSALPDGGAFVVGDMLDPGTSGLAARITPTGGLAWIRTEVGDGWRFDCAGVASDGSYFVGGHGLGTAAGHRLLLTKLEPSGDVAAGCWIAGPDTISTPASVTSTPWGPGSSGLSVTSHDTLQVTVVDGLPTPAPPCAVGEVIGLRCARSASVVDLTWGVEPSAETYEVYRGNVSAFDTVSYDHADMGACGLVSPLHGDPVALDGRSWYYLVVARNWRGRGPYGARSDGTVILRANPECP